MSRAENGQGTRGVEGPGEQYEGADRGFLTVRPLQQALRNHVDLSLGSSDERYGR